MSKLTKFKKNLIKKGYTKYEASLLYSELYQKCVTDEKGKKYFIDFVQKAAPKELGKSYFFLLNCQFNTFIDGKKLTIDISSNQWFNNDDKKYQDSFYPGIEEVEKFIENLWVLLGKNYYELF